MSAPRLVDEISNPPGHLSYSSASTWHDCPANYAAIREQPHLDTVTPAQIRGTLTHWVTETVCREAQQAGMDPGWDGQVMADLAVEAVEAFRADPGNTDDTAMFDSWSAQEQANILASVVECLTRLRFLDPLPAGIEIVGVEQRLETTVGGVPFVSIVDLAYRTSSGVVLVGLEDWESPGPEVPVWCAPPTPVGCRGVVQLDGGDACWGAGGVVGGPVRYRDDRGGPSRSVGSSRVDAAGVGRYPRSRVRPERFAAVRVVPPCRSVSDGSAGRDRP